MPVQPLLTDKMNHEISLYLSSTVINHSERLVACWAANQDSYSNVARVTCKLLAISATTVASERL